MGVPVVEVIRKAGINEQTFYRWKEQYVGLESDQVREMKQPQDENGRLKQLVAELSLDKTMLQDVLSKSGIAVAAPESTAKQDSENCAVPFRFKVSGAGDCQSLRASSAVSQFPSLTPSFLAPFTRRIPAASSG